MMQGDERKGKVKKGWLAVRVGAAEGGGGGAGDRFVIPIAYLYHPLFPAAAGGRARRLRL
ncbi:hypothetical protein PR202_ga02889 [Eleusine coracana subsp. coracana]|uniref:Uncharacterized protein n=1 Tax=Eleusine coracana subsp. coracana TaxID=191504 RepID=A0AAV5BMP8_ELECO|nr:hypothetical protein PR202_ga02889 [Eleusine coracana subsp. coracana]